MAVLPGVLECRLLRRTIQVRLGTNTLRLPGGTAIFVVSRQIFMKYPGQMLLAYAKAKKEDLSPQQLKLLRGIVETWNNG